MTEIPQSPSPEDQPEPTLAELAFRPGGPEEWEGIEHIWNVCDRICLVTGESHHTDDMKKAAEAELDRQTALFYGYRRQQRELEQHEALRQRMGGVAKNLVVALVAEDDPRDREAVMDSVLEALRPIDDRLVRAESDDRIGYFW